MPKRPVSQLTPSLEIHDFFSSKFFRVNSHSAAMIAKYLIS